MEEITMIAFLYFLLSVAGVVAAVISAYFLIKLIRNEFADDPRR